MKLAKKTSNALTGLDWALSELSEKPQQKDEFTVNEFMEATSKNSSCKTRESVHSRLKRMMQRGEVSCRKITIDGKRTNLYRRP